jgi:hypothetical protein
MCVFLTGAQWTPSTLSSTLSSLSSLLKPSPGNSSAFAVSLLAFGIALGTPTGQEQQQQQQQTTTTQSSSSNGQQRYYDKSQFLAPS